MRHNPHALAFVLTLILSALSLVLGALRHQPAGLPPADAAHRRLGDRSRASRRRADAGRRSTRAWVVAALFGLGWPLAQGEAFLYRAANPTGGDVLAGVRRDARRARSRAADDRLDSAGVGRGVSRATRSPARGSASIGLAGIAHRGYDLPRLVGNLYMTLEGIYGVPLDVAVTYIILFSLYGAVLERSGAGTFFLDFAMSLSSPRQSGARRPAVR